MHMTIGEAADKINSMRSIIEQIEAGAPVEHWIDDIAGYLDEYIAVLCNTKVIV